MLSVILIVTVASVFFNLFILFNFIVLSRKIDLNLNSTQEIQQTVTATNAKLANQAEKTDLSITALTADTYNLQLIERMDPTSDVLVYADSEWQKSGYFVNQGETVVIESAGLWTADRRIPVDGQNTNVKFFGWVNGDGNVAQSEWNSEYGPRMGLLAKINEQVFLVGEKSSLYATESGELEFAPNDLCCLGDNAGLLVVKITKAIEQ